MSSSTASFSRSERIQTTDSQGSSCFVSPLNPNIPARPALSASSVYSNSSSIYSVDDDSSDDAHSTNPSASPHSRISSLPSWVSELRLESDYEGEDEDPYYPKFDQVPEGNDRFMWLPSPSTYEKYNGNPFADEFEADVKTLSANTTSTQLSPQSSPSVLDEHPLASGPDCQSKLVGLGISALVSIPEKSPSPSSSYQTNHTPISSQNRSSSGFKITSSARTEDVAQAKVIGLGISARASYPEEHLRDTTAPSEQSSFMSDKTSSMEEDIISQAKPIGLGISARASYSNESSRNITSTSNSTCSISHSQINSRGTTPSSNRLSIDITTFLQSSTISSLRGHDSTGSQTVAGVEYKYVPEASSSIAIADTEEKKTHKRGLSEMVKTWKGKIVGKK